MYISVLRSRSPGVGSGTAISVEMRCGMWQDQSDGDVHLSVSLSLSLCATDGPSWLDAFCPGMGYSGPELVSFHVVYTVVNVASLFGFSHFI